MGKYLDAREVAVHAALCARALGMLRVPSIDDLAAYLRQRDAYPVMFTDGRIRMWVDRLYIAYSYERSVSVHYVYVTDRHIEEELRSYTYASMLRGKRIFLPFDIRRQFHEASLQIAAANKGTEDEKDEKRYVFLENLIANDSFDSKR